MPADTNSAAQSSTPVSGGSAAITGAGYSAQAADIAGTDERPGADGGRGTPTHDAQTTTDGSSEEDVATLKAALKAARAEAAATRKKAQELDELKQQLEDAKLSETEKLQKQLADYKAQIEALNLQKQEIALRARIDGAAASLGIKPELALRILDQSLVKYDEKGLPTNISELLSSAIEDFDLTPATSTAPSASSPVKPAVTSGGATSPARSTSGANGQHSLAAGEWTDARIASLTRDEYLANRASINAWRQKRGRGDGYGW